MTKKIVLTGFTPSGAPHIGNYIGMIKPALKMSQNPDYDSRYFISDLHSLITLTDANLRQQYILEIAASWLALGLDPDRTLFYKQSDVPQISELTWILNCVTAKGLLNRAHAYKAKVAEHEGPDVDAGISMGLYEYPVLMAADILMFKTNLVPVGKDQIQHVEIARDIAMRFNHTYKELFALPEAIVEKHAHTLPGLDGRKMSKSYHNTIELFAPSKKLRKTIMKIKTNSLPPEAPKSTENCTLFEIYCAFASAEQIEEITKHYAAGIAWGEMKQILFELIDKELADARKIYNDLIAHPDHINAILKKGGQIAKEQASEFLHEIKLATGL